MHCLGTRAESLVHEEAICGQHCYSVTKSCLTFCDPMNISTPDFAVFHYLPEFAQTHVHWVSDAIQPSHPLMPPSSLALILSQHQGLFQWVSSSHPKCWSFSIDHNEFITNYLSIKTDCFVILRDSTAQKFGKSMVGMINSQLWNCRCNYRQPIWLIVVKRIQSLTE